MVEAAIVLFFEVTSLVVLAFTSELVVVASVVTAAVVSGGCRFLVAELILPICVVLLAAVARLCHMKGCESFEHGLPKYDYWLLLEGNHS